MNEKLSEIEQTTLDMKEHFKILRNEIKLTYNDLHSLNRKVDVLIKDLKGFKNEISKKIITFKRLLVNIICD